MPFYTDYKCSDCGERFPKYLLVTKTVVYAPLGVRGRILRSRTVKFLCIECLGVDVEYNLPANSGPGMKSEGLERVRKVASDAAKDK